MGPITYALCHKPVIGVAMWISFLCTFPPPLPRSEISFATTGLVLESSFKIPVDKRYPLILDFTFQSAEERLSDQIVGTRYCRPEIDLESVPENTRPEYGQPIPIRVVIIRQADKEIVFNKTLKTQCRFGHTTLTKSRLAGYIDLTQGKYTIAIYNLSRQPALAKIKTEVILAGGTGK